MIHKGRALRGAVITFKFLLHQSAAYAFLRLCTPLLALVALRAPFVQHHSVGRTGLIITHPLLLIFMPTLFAAFVAGRFFRDRTAQYVWIIPALVFAAFFVFRSPTVYPTMILQSDFRTASRMWIGDGYHSLVNGYYQWKITAPVYVGLGYSIGAWLAIKSVSRSLITPVTAENS